MNSQNKYDKLPIPRNIILGIVSGVGHSVSGWMLFMLISLTTALKNLRTNIPVSVKQIDGMIVGRKLFLTPGSFKTLSGQTCRYDAKHCL
jgi:hypothetical protein